LRVQAVGVLDKVQFDIISSSKFIYIVYNFKLLGYSCVKITKMADFDEEIYDEEVDEGSYDEEVDDGYIEEVEVDDSEGDAEEIGAEGMLNEPIEWHADS
jgi:hypothetical protein